MSALPIRIQALFYREAARDFHVDAHHHAIHQWYFCLVGGMTVCLDGVFHELRPDDSLIVSPGLTRELWAGQRAPGYLVVIFDAREALDVAPIADRPLALPPHLREEVRTLVAEVRRPAGPDARLLSSLLVLRLLIGLVRTHGPHPQTAARRTLSALNAQGHLQVVAQAEAFMQRNLYRPLTRAEIAQAVNCSEPHLGRIFRAALGRSVIDRLIEMRMEHAKALLRESTLSVTQIAGEVGITSFSHFSKTFKAVVGVPPSDYRRSGGRAYH